MLTRRPVIAAISSLAILMLVMGNVQAKGSAERGGDLSFDCIECHGMDGEGNWETPPIAGLKESHILKQLRDFSSGKRKSMDGIMHLYTEDRSDQELQDLAAFWASKKKS
jgi:cytochrome c553